MVEYKAILKLVPSVKPRRTERYPGNYPSTDDAEALISEEADRNSQIQKDTRELVFTPSTKIYLIGRASGNPTRGLVARRNNGFFLSPVMSRYHAEVQMLESKKAIRIKDTNSMHGTFVNNLSIWSGEWKELSSGDTITFGTQVARDGEVFTPKDFKCDIQWEALPPVKPDPPKDMSTKTSRLSSGYGVLSEDLIISDDDTESVDYDKGVGEYPLFSEEEYSENSEEEEEAEEIDDDEEDENDGMDEDEDITFDREDSAISTEIVSVSTAHTVVKNSQTQQKSSTDGPKPTEERNKVEPEHQTTSTTATTPTSRKKFSITSLMNETREQNRNSLADGEEGESTSEKATSSKGKEKEASSPVVKYPGEKPGAFGKWQSPKIREEPASNSYPKNTVSLLDGAELLIQNATNKPKIAPWNNPSHVNESSNRTTADLDAVKVGSPPLPPASYLPLPTIAKLDHLARASKLLAAELKSDLPVQKPCPAPTADSIAKSSSGPSAAQAGKEDFFAARKENAARAQIWWKNQSASSSISPTFAAEVHSARPLPWVKGFSSSATVEKQVSEKEAVEKQADEKQAAEKQTVATPVSIQDSNTKPITVVESVQKNLTPTGRHVFEQILSSAEAKARTERLRKIKAALRQSKDQSTFNPWAVEDDVYRYFDGRVAGSNMDLDEGDGESEAPIVTDEQPSEPCHKLQDANHTSCVTSRSFSISNLVHDSTDYRKWVAEKVAKAAKTPLERKPVTESVALVHVQAAGTKRKYEDISEDDKMVKESEEKIQFSDAMECDCTYTEDAREVSQEKETYEDTYATAVELKGKERAAEEATVVEKPVMEEVAVIEKEEPKRKRSRIWSGATAGFALGAVTGAVGVFAALVATAP